MGTLLPILRSIGTEDGNMNNKIASRMSVPSPICLGLESSAFNVDGRWWPGDDDTCFIWVYFQSKNRNRTTIGQTRIWLRGFTKATNFLNRNDWYVYGSILIDNSIKQWCWRLLEFCGKKERVSRFICRDSDDYPLIIKLMQSFWDANYEKLNNGSMLRKKKKKKLE